jgi:hypothetical protein
MLGYLEAALYDRSNNAAFKEHSTDENIIKYERIDDLLKKFESTISKEQDSLYSRFRELENELDVSTRTACYRAGWLDGIVLGVLAGTRANGE